MAQLQVTTDGYPECRTPSCKHPATEGIVTPGGRTLEVCEKCAFLLTAMEPPK